MDLDSAPKRRQREPVEIEGVIEVCVCRDLWIDVCLLQEVESEFSLWEELVPDVNQEVVVGAGTNGNEMRFEVLDGHLRNITTMAVRLDKFELVCFVNELLHAVGALVVKDVLLDDNSCFLNAMEKSKIGPLHFDVLAA